MASLNLNVLKRHDAAVADIVEAPAYVHLYKYSDGSWTKTGIEGTLLLFRRSRGVAHGFFILNRNGLENFSADLTSEEDVELNDPLIIINPPDSDDVHGIYVTDKERSASIGKRMLELGQLSRTASEIGLMPPKPSTSKAAEPPAPVKSSNGTSLSIDALFSAARPNGAGPSHSSAPDSGNLLEAFFKNAQPAQQPSQRHQRQSSEKTLADIQAAQANGLALLQQLGIQSPPSSRAETAPSPPQPQQRSPPAAMLVPRRVSDRHKRSPPSQPRALSQSQPPAVPEAARPPAAQTEVDDVEAAVLTQPTWSQARNDDGTPFTRPEYVRHLLTLIHTEPTFVEALHQRYLARINS